MRNDSKPLQVRKTLQDTISYQNELHLLVKRKKENNAILSFDERDRFIEIYPLAVLSHGSNPCFYRTIKGIIRFEHMDMLAYFLSEQTSNVVSIIDINTNKVHDRNIPISDIWKFFERQLVYLFPFAREEAAHMSAEAPVKEPPTSYTFSSDKQ